MPKTPIDYSKTDFYKIICRDLNIQDFYIGHTTDFKTRKGCHKRVCNNPNDKNHNMPLYKFIRDNEGWDNFDMIWLETQNYQTSKEARKREQDLITELKPSLNSMKAYTSEEERKAKKQEWEENNREHTKEYKHNWNFENKDRVSERKKQKYKENPEPHIERSKRNYHKNIQGNRNKRNRVCDCPCGETYTYANKKRHERISVRHQEYLQSLV